MKLLGIIWNCVDKEAKEIIKKDICHYAKIASTYTLNMDNYYEEFLMNIYPKVDGEADKGEFKIKTLYNQYRDNNIELLIIDIDPGEKVFLKQKNKYMYKNVLDLKVNIRRKYKYLIKTNGDYNSSYSNIFHLTDDELEYQEELPFIINFLSRYYSGIINIDNFIEPYMISPEHRGTRKKYWIYNDLLYKENTFGTYEAYNEIFNMYFMKLFGLNNGAKYLLSSFKNNYGVITKKINDTGETIVFLHNILKEYGYKSKQDIVTHNSLEEWPFYLKDYCFRHNLNYNDDCITELKKLFLYDIFTCQNDRNPTNMCLIINNGNIRIGYFDHSNMLFLYDKDLVNDYFIGKMNMDEYLNDKVSTFLLNKSYNIEFCFQNKLLHLQSYLETANKEDIKLYESFKEVFTLKNILYTFEQIEKRENIMLPIDYKEVIIKYYYIFIKRLGIIESRDSSCLKKERV